MGKSSTISDAEWALAKRRARVLAELVSNKECSHAIINRACATLRVSRAMMFRLLARYREDQRTSALLPKTPGRKRGSSGLGKEREEIISAQIRKFYLTREKRPVAALHREIAADCAKHRLRIPAYGSVVRRLQAFDRRTLVAKREGPQQARQKFRTLHASPAITKPLQLVQIDHTLVDVIVVDELERKTIGRPWLTLAIDVATRAVLGFHLSLADPNSTSVALTLSMSIGTVSMLGVRAHCCHHLIGFESGTRNAIRCLRRSTYPSTDRPPPTSKRSRARARQITWQCPALSQSARPLPALLPIFNSIRFTPSIRRSPPAQSSGIQQVHPRKISRPWF